jgi:hypothetical protein
VLEQVLSVLLVLPFSRRTYRVINMIMMEALWSELIWLMDWWAGVRVSDRVLAGVCASLLWSSLPALILLRE